MEMDVVNRQVEDLQFDKWYCRQYKYKLSICNYFRYATHLFIDYIHQYITHSIFLYYYPLQSV